MPRDLSSDFGEYFVYSIIGIVSIKLRLCTGGKEDLSIYWFFLIKMSLFFFLFGSSLTEILSDTSYSVSSSAGLTSSWLNRFERIESFFNVL